MADIDFSNIYSFSKLNLFDNCKKQYYFNYLDPEIAPRKKEFIKPRDYKTKGQAVHGAITLFYHLPDKERTLENLKKCLEQAWFSELNSDLKPPLGLLGGFKDIEHEREAYRESLIMLKNFFELKDDKPSLFLIPSKNIKDSFDDYKDMIKPIGDKISISGKFDQIDKLENNNLRIIDFKTGKNNQNIFQLEFYKLLAELNFNSKVETVSFYYLGNKKIKNYNAFNIDNEKVREEILEKVETIKNTKKFPPNPTRLCSHCDFQEICPVFKKVD
jgi:putative RecB family exonuclease